MLGRKGNQAGNRDDQDRRTQGPTPAHQLVSYCLPISSSSANEQLEGSCTAAVALGVTDLLKNLHLSGTKAKLAPRQPGLENSR